LIVTEESEKWEDEAGQENEMEQDGEEEPVPVNVMDDSGPKKEHVNVVFIGHVGMYPRQRIKIGPVSWAICQNRSCIPGNMSK
jgi:hypothetical protein